MADTRADRVYKQASSTLFRLLNEEEAVLRGKLADLRHGLGTRPGEDPRAWGMLLSDLPEEMLGRYGKPSSQEWAVYTALTLFALHQQGKDPKKESVNEEKVSLGTAAYRMACHISKEENCDMNSARERVSRRFYQVALASDIAALSYHLRGFIQLLRANDIGLDYPRLARDLYLYQLPEGAASVRLQWGQDYYSKKNDDDQEDNENE